MLQQFTAESQLELALPIGEQTEVPDALKPWRQSVDEEAPDELIGGQSHLAGFLFIPMAVVFPLKRDLTVVYPQQALVGAPELPFHA